MFSVYWQKRYWLFLGIWSLLVTVFLYGQSLSLPFFFDDFVHIPYVDGYSIPQMLTTAGELAYYRPLTFIIWKTMWHTLGHHSTTIQHSFNLLLHISNGFLVGLLAQKLWPKDQNAVRGLLATTFFLCFPFSYQAVPWVGSASHLLVTFCILLTLHAYFLWQDTTRKRWLIISLITTTLGLFTHENGILILPLLGAIVLTNETYKNIVSRITRLFIWLIPVVIWFPIWWFAPKAISGDITIRGGEAIYQNATFFLQGIGYPLTWLGVMTMNRLAWSDFTAVQVWAGLALAIALFVQLVWGQHRRRLLPWLWLVIAMLPSILFLTFDYVINGSRLLMVMSVGVALLWSDVASIVWQKVAANPIKRGLLLLVVLLVVGQNAVFVRQLMAQHVVLGRATDQVTELTVNANLQGRRALFVNLPSWTSSVRRFYAVGNLGVQFWPNYAWPESRVAVQTGESADFLFRQANSLKDTPNYYYGASGSNLEWVDLHEENVDIFIGRYTDTTIHIEPIGFTQTPLINNVETTFVNAQGQPQIKLFYQTEQRVSQLMHGYKAQLNLTWQAIKPNPDITVFVHIVDTSGKLVGQVDKDPVGGAYPFAFWQPNQTLTDVRLFDLPETAHAFRIGLFQRSDGQRLQPISEQEIIDNAIVIPIKSR